ncbi:MAG: XdhC family protein [Acidobacteriota bacterium]
MDALRRLVHALEAGSPCVLATVTAVRGSAPRGPGTRLLVELDGTRTGTVGGGEVERAALALARELLTGTGDVVRSLEVDSHCGGVVTLLVERFGSPRTLVVVGGGHVGWAVAECGARAGFQVTVLDRQGAASLPDVPGVTVRAVEDPSALSHVSAGPDAQIVVATGSHTTDAEWALAALAGPFAGVGVVGSRSKAAALREAARRAGVSDERLGILRCPIGLDLGAVTPGEIAVAIVAELVTLAHRGEVPPAWRKPSRG